MNAMRLQCRDDNANWMLVPSRAVDRLLRICDPESQLPRCDSVSAAVSKLRGNTPLLQLVTKSR